MVFVDVIVNALLLIKRAAVFSAALAEAKAAAMGSCDTKARACKSLSQVRCQHSLMACIRYELAWKTDMQTQPQNFDPGLPDSLAPVSSQLRSRWPTSQIMARMSQLCPACCCCSASAAASKSPAGTELRSGASCLCFSARPASTPHSSAFMPCALRRARDTCCRRAA